MRIVVGSENPAKLEAVREIVKDYPHLADAEVVGVAVHSGVADQPMSLVETTQGAITRAKNAFRDCDYAIGIESGFVRIPQATHGLLEMTVCAVWDGARVHLGLSPGFECPAEVMRLVREEKLDLSTACHRAGFSPDAEVGKKEGIIGILTKGRMTRAQYTGYALRTAFINIDPV